MHVLTFYVFNKRVHLLVKGIFIGADVQFINSPFEKMKFILVSDIKMTYQTLKNNIGTFVGCDSCDSEQTV